jgi:alkylhydroperoxidase family enzyme
MRLKEPRIEPLPEKEWPDDIREILEPTRQQGRLLNIFTTLARHPRLFKRWMTFGGQLLFKTSLPLRDRELLILRVSWLTRGEYEWGQHTLIARQVGLTDEEINRVRSGPGAHGWSVFDSTLLQAVDELHSNTLVSESTWQFLSRRFDEQQLIEILFIVGHYTLLAMVLNSLGVQLEDDIEGFPADE